MLNGKLNGGREGGTLNLKEESNHAKGNASSRAVAEDLQMEMTVTNDCIDSNI